MQALQSFLKAKDHQRRKNKRARKRKKEAKEEMVVRATEDTRIAPHHLRNVRVNGPFDQEHDWFVERNLVPDLATSFLAIPNIIISSADPRIPVANPTSIPQMIRKGDILGIARKANEYLDKVTDASQKEMTQKTAMFI